MFLGSNTIYIHPFSMENHVKSRRIRNLKLPINREGGKDSKFNKRGGPNKSVEGGKFPEINKRACPFIRHLRV